MKKKYYTPEWSNRMSRSDWEVRKSDVNVELTHDTTIDVLVFHTADATSLWIDENTCVILVALHSVALQI